MEPNMSLDYRLSDLNNWNQIETHLYSNPYIMILEYSIALKCMLHMAYQKAKTDQKEL